MPNGRPRTLNKRALAATFAGATLGVALGVAPVASTSARSATPSIQERNSEQPPVGPGAGKSIQPSAGTAASSSGYEVSFQANSGNLWTVGTAGNTSWPLGMMGNTSSSIASLATGGQEAAFQANSGNLWTVGSAGNVAWPLGMMAGTSPSIAALPGGGYEVAFQANSGNLWTVGSAGNVAWPLGMMPGTSPGITGAAGGYEVAFQANSGNLWTVGSGGNVAWPLGMMARTSPSIAGLGSGYEVAFEANSGNLWTVGSAGNTAWPLGLSPAGGPTITGAATTGSSQVAYSQSQPAPTSQPDNNFGFEVTNSAGTPARWNSCESVHYVVVSNGAPAGWQNDVSNDISQAANATGLSFVSDGTAGSAPSNYKGIVISWASQLSGSDTVGLTNYQYYNVSSYAPQIVAATIQLLTSLKAGGGTSGEQPVLLHELGHALGLAHVNASEVMNPVDQGYSSYHPGDLNGLTHLGSSQGCSNFYS